MSGAPVEIVNKKHLMLFSGTAHPDLSREIADDLGVPLSDCKISRFASSEVYVRAADSVRGADVFVIQTHCAPVNENIWEQLVMIDAMKRASAKRITAVIPYYGYSRQDKKTLSREPITAKLVADVLATAGADRDRYRLLFVDQRANGRSDKASTDTWTLPQMAADVSLLARALRLDRYAVLGHSYGALVALQHAVDHPGHAAASIISGGVPAARFFEETQRNLETFEPVELRKQVADSWAREIEVRTQEEAAELIHDQLPFHFADPFDPRIEEYERRSAGAVYAPDVLRHFAAQQYGGIDVEDLLDEVTEPVLVISGRHERTCVVEGAELMAKGLTNAELLILENSAHMTFVEEQGPYLDAVRGFMDRVAG